MKNYLRVQSDGTSKGTKVFLPDGMQLMLRSLAITVAVLELEECEMEYYLTRKLSMRLDGSHAGSGLFLENGTRIDGVIEMSTPPYTGFHSGTAKVKFYPKGATAAIEDKEENQ
jgi:hypothetical protein